LIFRKEINLAIQIIKHTLSIEAIDPMIKFNSLRV